MAIPIYGDPQMFGWREGLAFCWFTVKPAVTDKRRRCRASRYLPRGSVWWEKNFAGSRDRMYDALGLNGLQTYCLSGRWCV